jgi:hypothetical protein
MVEVVKYRETDGHGLVLVLLLEPFGGIAAILWWRAEIEARLWNDYEETRHRVLGSYHELIMGEENQRERSGWLW